jgi:competence protein ComEC
MRRALVLGLTLLLGGLTAYAQDTLDVYLIDVEGGNATLFVSPEGESILIDTGNGGAAADRDAGRIIEAMDAAGIDGIDHLITTHWHGDHFGSMEELAGRVQIGHYIDHGPSIQPNANTDAFIAGVYRELYENASHTVVEPGDTIEVAGINVTVMASGKQVVDGPLPGAGASNPYCQDFVPQGEDNGENAQSVGVLVEYGDFRALHLGDLTANTEFELMCPNNPIGTVDLYVVSHHGQPSSNVPALVHAIAPRVAIMNNGTRKGGQPDAMRVLHSSPGLEDLWQLHFSQLSGQEYTVPGMFIANLVDEPMAAMPVAPMPNPGRGAGAPPAPTHNGAAYWIKVSGQNDGAFSVTNSRTGFSKEYR